MAHEIYSKLNQELKHNTVFERLEAAHQRNKRWLILKIYNNKLVKTFTFKISTKTEGASPLTPMSPSAKF